MARAIWTGAISFGLVNVPVKMFTATSPKTVRFHQINADTGARIRQKRVDESTGDEVPTDKIVKGYEMSRDNYVLVDPEALEALDATRSDTIDITAFVDLEEIDPIYYDSAYYLAPAAGGAKAYKLLCEALAEENKVAIGTFVLRSKQRLCALRTVRGEGDEPVMALSTMLWGDEVNPTGEIDGLDLLAQADTSKRELDVARQFIQMQTVAFEPGDYRDEHREQVLALIEATAAGEEPTPAPKPAAPKAAPDLMAALEASLAAAGGRKPAAAKKPSASKKKPAAAAKKAPARKPAAKS